MTRSRHRTQQPTRDLVGWATNPSTRRQRELTPEVTRDLLAAALGLTAEQLRGLEPAAMTTALRRLRGMVAQSERLAAAAAVDDLTGALRRGTGIAMLDREIARSRRLGQRGLVVAFMDVDGLKALNDTQGHAAGDRLLCDVVGAVRERVRAYDVVLRYGGDEFVCALLDVTLEQAQRTVRDILDNVRLRSGGHTFSTGFAELGPDDTATAIIARADAALYRGRGRATAARAAD